MGIPFLSRPGQENAACKCAGKASGFNCVKIDMSRILGQYVERAKEFRNAWRAIATSVIVFVDEIDTAFRRESGDSGVSRNIFSEFTVYR